MCVLWLNLFQIDATEAGHLKGAPASVENLVRQNLIGPSQKAQVPVLVVVRVAWNKIMPSCFISSKCYQ